MINPFEDEPSKTKAPMVLVRKPQAIPRDDAPMDLPHNVEAEMGLLCSAMISKEAFWGMLESVPEEMFHVEQHVAIWRAIKDLHNAKTAIDPITLAKQIEKQGVGVEPKVLKDIFTFLPSEKNWREYLKFCQENLHRRKLYRTAQRIMQQALSPEKSPEHIKQSAERSLESIADQRGTIIRVSEAVKARLEDWEEAARTQGASSMGLMSGIEKWDQATRGFKPGTVHVIVGESKGGKTTLALQMALRPAIYEKRAMLYCSLEMSVESLIDKMVCGESRVSMKKLTSGELSPTDQARFMKAVNQIYESPIYIYPGSHMNPQKFTALAHRAKEEFNIEVIVVDYFQLMDGDDLRKNREQQLSDVGRSMKTVAKELGIPIILIAQLNDNGKLRETRSLQMHADTLTKIMASKADKERHILSIDYNREGETAKIACRFLKEFGRFEQIEDGETNEDDFEE